MAGPESPSFSSASASCHDEHLCRAHQVWSVYGLTVRQDVPEAHPPGEFLKLAKQGATKIA